MFDAVKALFGRREKPVEPATAPRADERVRIVNPYHAVSIKAGPRCCQAARSLSGARFLSKEAPRIPLPQCELACECRYVHHDDRRSTPRRSADGAAPRGGPPFAGLDRRRARQDRRTAA
jgi:hypothetical protein